MDGRKIFINLISDKRLIFRKITTTQKEQSTNSLISKISAKDLSG